VSRFVRQPIERHNPSPSVDPYEPPEQMSGMPSLAPLLNQIKAAVVTVTITAAPGEKRIPPRPGTSCQHARSRAERQVKATGSGVIIDAEKGLIFTNNHVIDGADDIS